MKQEAKMNGSVTPLKSNPVKTLQAHGDGDWQYQEFITHRNSGRECLRN